MKDDFVRTAKGPSTYTITRLSDQAGRSGTRPLVFTIGRYDAFCGACVWEKDPEFWIELARDCKLAAYVKTRSIGQSKALIQSEAIVAAGQQCIIDVDGGWFEGVTETGSLVIRPTTSTLSLPLKSLAHPLHAAQQPSVMHLQAEGVWASN
jgi:hypothetical protein